MKYLLVALLLLITPSARAGGDCDPLGRVAILTLRSADEIDVVCVQHKRTGSFPAVLNCMDRAGVVFDLYRPTSRAQ